jgi:hypothetical protein
MPAQFLSFAGSLKYCLQYNIPLASHNPQHNNTQQTTIKMSAATLLSSSGFALSLHDYGSGASNSWLRRSLWAHARRAPLG